MGIIAGCDLDCGKSYGQNLQDALDQGLVTVDQLEVAASRLMTVRVLLGLFDPPENVPYSNITLTSVDFKANAQLALESARQSLVLLKNESNFLPLNANKVQKVAVIGPLGNTCHLGGYAAQTPTTVVSPVQGIAKRLGVSVPLNPSYIKGDEYSALNGTIATQPSPIGTNQLAFISNGNWAKFDNVDFTGKTSLVASVSSPFDRISIDVHLDAVDGPLACTLAVPNTRDWNTLANATASLNGITGSHNIYLVFNGCGGYFLNVEHLALEPVSAESGWTGGKQVIYRSGCRVTGDRVPRDFQDAVDVAKGADVVILVCGVNGDVDQEQRDRDDIRLTGAQPDLIQAVYAANPNTVLVLSSNNSVSVVWEQDNLPAIVGAICAGQEQGTAIAQLLFGDFNPGGKLPNTWYRSIDQLPDKHDYDIHNGRTYQYFTDKPLYPFGYGLSYTSFQIGSLTASSQTIASGGTAKYSVKVTNTGKVAGAEVVQLYVTAPATLVRRPLRQLAAFQRVELAPGEHKTVVFELPYTTQAFWYWDDDVKAFVCSSGEAQIQIGNSSASLPLTASLVLPHGQMPATAPDAVETVAGTSYIVQS